MSKKEEEQELSFGQRFDKLEPRKEEVTMKDFESSKPAPKTRRERFNDKFIKTGKGNLARRGTVGARRAENIEKNRNRAKQMAKARRNK
tara:strand:- start:50 stop:316 length:267 start_codon:yes stop_codon:yes gene_type:complete